MTQPPERRPDGPDEPLDAGYGSDAARRPEDASPGADQTSTPPSHGDQPEQGQPYAPPSYAPPEQEQISTPPPPGYPPGQGQPAAGAQPGSPGPGAPASGPYAPPGQAGWDAQAPGAYGQPSEAYGSQQSAAHGQAPSGPYAQQQPAGYPPPGYPAPGYGAYPPAPVGGQPPLAVWGKRALGALLDFVVPGAIVNSVLSSVFPTQAGQVNWIANIGTLIIYLALAAYSAQTGQTWGRQVARTQLVGEDGRPIGLAKGFLRYILHFLDSLPLFLGWLWPLWDAKRQTFADKIMKTYVLDVSASGPINVQPSPPS